MLASAFVDDLQVHETDRYSIAGFDFDMPEPRSSIETLARQHGSQDFTDLLGHRSFPISGEVWGTTYPAFWSAVNALKARLLPAPHVLRFTPDGWIELQATVRPASRADIPMRGGAAFTTWAVTLVAADPRLYSSTLSTASYDPSTATQGIGVTFPLTFPLTFTGTAATTLPAENAGTFPTPPTFTIRGPATNPVIENVSTDESIVTTATLASVTDFLWIDVHTREVRLGGAGGTLRPDLIDVSASRFFQLQPGVNQLRLTGSSFAQGETNLTAEWRSAWI